MNQGKYHHKTSQIERKLNLFLFFNICVLFVLAGIISGKAYHFAENYGPYLRYIYPRWNPDLGTPRKIAVGDMAIFYLILNTLLPIAIVVVLEIVKLIYTKAVEADAEMMLEDYFVGDVRMCSV